MSLTLFKLNIESLVFSRTPINGSIWRSMWNAIDYGGLTPLLDEINQTFDRLYFDSASRFSQGDWDSEQTYDDNAIVEDITAHPTYDPENANYLVGQCVSYNGKNWEALQQVSSTSPIAPGTDSDVWEDITQTRYYRSVLVTNEENRPSSSDAWEAYKSYELRAPTKKWYMKLIHENFNDDDLEVTNVLIGVHENIATNKCALQDINQKDAMTYFDNPKYIPTQMRNHYFAAKQYSEGARVWGDGTEIPSDPETIDVGTLRAFTDENGDMVVATSLVSSNDDENFKDPSKWNIGFYTGQRPKDDDGEFLGNPATRYILVSTAERKTREFTISFLIADVKEKHAELMSFLKPHIPLCFTYEVIDNETGNTYKED